MKVFIAYPADCRLRQTLISARICDGLSKSKPTIYVSLSFFKVLVILLFLDVPQDVLSVYALPFLQSFRIAGRKRRMSLLSFYTSCLPSNHIDASDRFQIPTFRLLSLVVYFSVFHEI